MYFELDHEVCKIWGTITPMGPDYTIAIQGGSHPHIGSVVMAIPRPSLSGSGISATASTLNHIGHKDDVIATDVAKEIASRLNTVVVCSCGIHFDDASAELIEGIVSLKPALIECILETIARN